MAVSDSCWSQGRLATSSNVTSRVLRQLKGKATWAAPAEEMIKTGRVVEMDFRWA